MLAALSDVGLLYLVGGGIAAVMGLVLLVIILKYGLLWLRAASCGAKVGLFDMVYMAFRRVPQSLIVNNRIKAVKAGVDISSADMQAYYLNGGDVSTVVEAVIRAKNANIMLDWPTACEMARTRRDLLGAVETSIRPRIIDVPASSSG
ncbi:MAG: flotillin-like FloA family protein, partial [Planctomycetota bacterium]